MNSLFGVRFVMAAFAMAMCSQLRAADELAARFELFSERIKTFGQDDFLFGFRETRWTAKENQTAVRDFSQFLIEGNAPAGAIALLLKHKSPKVRTLAAVGLYDKEDPQLLPLLIPLLDDAAGTFPAPIPVSRIPNMTEPDPTREQSVGEVVHAIVNIYLQSAGYYYGPEGKYDHPGFDDYWRMRSKRSFCAGWFKVKLDRASQGTSPTQKQRLEAIHKLRAQIDAVPQPDRTWILIWLNGESGSDALATEDELAAMLRMIDHDSLLSVLRRAAPTDDPDMQSRKDNNYSFHRLCIFILKHAREVLKADDAAALLAQEKIERESSGKGTSDPLIDPVWAVAAATLKPEDARSILRDAHSRFNSEYDGDRRLALAEALWDLNGAAETATVVDWFYAELQKPPQSTHALSSFISTIQHKPRDNRPFVAALINDARFETLNWKSVEAVARAVNSYTPAPVVPPEQFERMEPAGDRLLCQRHGIRAE